MSNSEKDDSHNSSESNEMDQYNETIEQIVERYVREFEKMGYHVQATQVYETIYEVHFKINNRWYAYDYITGIKIEDYSDEENKEWCLII